jgi:hypothetical protein
MSILFLILLKQFEDINYEYTLSDSMKPLQDFNYYKS